MQAMTILLRCRRAEGEMEQLRRRIDRRHDVMTAIEAARMDEQLPGSGQGDPDRLGRLMGDVDELEQLLASRREAYAVELTAACVLLDQVDDLSGRVLDGYYISRETLSHIAHRMNYAISYVRRKKKEAEIAMNALPAEIVASALPPWYVRAWPE